ncbi:hypothetical protein NDU88_001958, partial [Pleurodeles waltl]
MSMIAIGNCSRVPEHPAINNGSPHRERCPGGTTRAEPEDASLGNLDIRIPTVETPGERPREKEDDGSRRTKTDEDDARTEGNPDQEDVVAGERQRGRPTEEESHPEQLTPIEALDGESPETRRLRHVPGGVWLQQSLDLLFLPRSSFLRLFPPHSFPPPLTALPNPATAYGGRCTTMRTAALIL